MKRLITLMAVAGTHHYLVDPLMLIFTPATRVPAEVVTQYGLLVAYVLLLARHLLHLVRSRKKKEPGASRWSIVKCAEFVVELNRATDAFLDDVRKAWASLTKEEGRD